MAKEIASTTKKEQIDVQAMIDSYVVQAHVALDKMANFSQEQVDKICEAIAKVGEQNSYLLAKMAVKKQDAVLLKIKQLKICLPVKISGIACVMKRQ